MGEILALSADSWGLIIALILIVLFFTRAESKITAIFNDIKSKEDHRDSILAESSKCLKELHDRASQTARLQQESIGQLQRLSEFLSEADRRSTKEHAELLTIVREKINK